MAPTIRPFIPTDTPALVELSLAAWAPVFVSIERQLAGSGLYETLRPDWRDDQRRAVRAACADSATTVLVAEADGAVAGFVAVTRRDDGPIGELHLIAVDPAHQRRGIGRRLTDAALGWIGDQGLATAMVETGGDPGHGPARRLYESAGFTPLPIVRYFKRM